MGVIIKSISTIRFISEVKGYKFLSMFLISVDTILFILIFNDILSQELSAPIIASLIAGYLTGYNIGTFIEDKIALGKVTVNIKIRESDSEKLKEKLKKNGFIFVESEYNYSHKGKKRCIYQGILLRKELPKLKKVLSELDVIATVQEVKEVCGKTVIPSKKYLRYQNRSD